MQVRTADGNNTMIASTENTRIKSSGGFLGLSRNKLAADALLNGLPVSVETLQWDGGLVASEGDLKSKDHRTASLIHTGTDQRIAEQTAATEALRDRVGDIDQYDVESTPNVNFDTGKAVLSAQAKADLVTAASQADATVSRAWRRPWRWCAWGGLERSKARDMPSAPGRCYRPAPTSAAANRARHPRRCAAAWAISTSILSKARGT